MTDEEPKCECSGPGFCQRYQIGQDQYAYWVCSETCPIEHPCGHTKSQIYKRKWRLKLAEQSQNGPNLPKKIGNAAKAFVKSAATGFKRTPLEIVEVRQKICNECEFNKDNFCRHPNCGCPLTSNRVLFGTVTRPSKLEIASEKCPMGKWNQVVEIEL